MYNLESKPNIPLYFIRFFLFTVLMQTAAFELHELGHYFVGICLGLSQKFIMTGVIVNDYMNNTQKILHGLGGPVVSLILATLFLFLFLKYKKSLNTSLTSLLLAAVYANTFLRILPMATNLLSDSIKFQDEYKIATLLGLPGISLCITSLIIFSAIFITSFVNSGNNKIIKFIVFFIGCAFTGISINIIASLIF